MDDKRRVKIERERSVIAYSEFWHASWCLLEQGRSQEGGSYYQFMGSLVFTAFTFEAYLNHVGPKVFQSHVWNGVERLNPKDKLKAVAEALGLDIEFGRRPWQVVKKLFDFRNDIAHGKSIVLKGESTVPLSEYKGMNPWDFLKTDWEKFCSRDDAERAREDVESMIMIIHEKRGDKEDLLFTTGFGSTSASVLDE
jgi:hypothetical protein